MATTPTVKTLTNTSVEVLNAIRNQASQTYRDYVPFAQPSSENPESIKQIGAVIMDYPALQNEFISALINRIGAVIVTSKMYSNPWSFFKRGILELGETVEEIFVNLAKPFQFDQEVAETEVFKREIPDVRSAFHPLNYKIFYKQTIDRADLAAAFTSWEGVTDLIARITEAMYTAANYDEFLVMKYTIARAIVDGHLYAVGIGSVSSDNAEDIAVEVKALSNDLTFMSSDYNVSGVKTHTVKNDQFLIMNSEFDASTDVRVLAAAFNMDKAEFLGHRVLVDSFGKLDSDRLDQLLGGNPSYVPFTTDELALLNAVPAVLVDRDWFMIYDNQLEFTENYNGQGRYWNWFYHTWKTFSFSPFANGVVLTQVTPSVTGVTVSPTTASVSVGGTLQMSATAATTGFANAAIVWSVSNDSLATIDSRGLLTAVAAGTVTVYAESEYDSTKRTTATITITA